MERATKIPATTEMKALPKGSCSHHAIAVPKAAPKTAAETNGAISRFANLPILANPLADFEAVC